MVKTTTKPLPNDRLDFGPFSNPVRAFFEDYRVRTVGLLQLVTPRQLKNTHNVGPKRLASVVNYLAPDGLRLRGDTERFGGRLHEVYGDGKNAPVEAFYLCLQDPTVPVLNVERLVNNLRDGGITTLGQFYRIRAKSGSVSRYFSGIRHDISEVRWMQGWLAGVFSP